MLFTFLKPLFIMMYIFETLQSECNNSLSWNLKTSYSFEKKNPCHSFHQESSNAILSNRMINVQAFLLYKMDELTKMYILFLNFFNYYSCT